MTEKRIKPEVMPWITPYLMVKDVAEAINFYQKAFGFELGKDPMKNKEGTPVHAELKHQQGMVMLGAEGAWGGTARTPANSGVETPVSLYVYCEDVDKQFNQAISAGATMGFEPEDMFWGDRVCNVKDPDGHSWSFATNFGEFDPSKIPQ